MFQSEENTTDKGNIGESIAIDFLKSKGFKILKKNFKFGRVGEIDIIAEDKKTLVFVEVKARTNEKFGDPLLSITLSKQKKIRKTAEGYLYVNNIQNQECRFDVIVIDLRNNKQEIEHLINAL